MGILQASSTVETTGTGLSCDLTEGFRLQVDHLATWLVRIAIVPEEGLSVDRTWMVAPDGDVPWEGRDRLSLEGFSCPAVLSNGSGFSGEDLSVELETDPLRLVIRHKREGEWHTILEDRPNGAYQWFEKSKRLKHFQLAGRDDAHYGLGDKTGKLDRTGRRLRCLQSDALGYNAETSDPLYKHAPWLTALRDGQGAGLLYDTMAETVFDLAAEHSNYFPRFRHVEMHEKGMVLYVLAGPSMQDIVPHLHLLTGRIALPPRWSLGFAFTTMHHADSENAQQVITDFAREARQRNLPISAIHLGSGYTAGADGLRYVFNWNTNRFPDGAQFFQDLNAMGYRTCANIKPVLLTGHQNFKRASSAGWFVRRANGDAAIEMFWGGEGANLDFTNQRAVDFWQNGVSQQVLSAGFDAAWNDNNEAELWDETAIIDGFGKSLPAMESRPVHALLMTRASYEAMLRHSPNERPYTISRAGPIGIARYGETWSGDNRTSWHTLKWNLRQGLSMSLSGMPLVGHDVGGFDGPPPEPELLVRWFQMMALHPRCVMNSWKADYDNIPNLPWMHESVFDAIKSAMRLRYRFLPLIYSLIYRAHITGHPVIAPTEYYFSDVHCRADCDTFMLGPDVLVAPIMDEGAERVSAYLPEGSAWVSYNSKEQFDGGQWVEIDCPIDQLQMFIRAGVVLPLASDWADHAPHDAISIELTPFGKLNSGTGQAELFWDDGLSLVDQYSDTVLAYHWSWNAGKCDVEYDLAKADQLTAKITEPE